MKITKKIFNKVLFAVIVALVFSFINRCSVKALEEPFYTTGSLNFNISVADSQSGPYITFNRSINYDFTTLYNNESSNFSNYRYYLITLMVNPSLSDYYILDVMFTNSQSLSFSNTGGLTSTVYRVRYNTNVKATDDSIIGATSFNSTNLISTTTTTGDLSIVGYYGLQFYSNWDNWNNRQDFTDTTNVINIYKSYFNTYYCPVGNCGSYPRYTIFSNYSGWVKVQKSNGTYDDVRYTSYIGEYIPTINYNIDFVTINSSDNSQEEYGNDLTITGVATAIKYSPCDNDSYNYYYGFIENSNDDIDWVQVNDNKCIGSYVANKNGYLLAKIEDKNGGFLYSKTFNIRNVGTLSTFAVNNNKFSTFLTDISSNINYGGPISGLITIPINLMSTLYNSFNGTCTAYNLGTILGHNVVFNCFTLQSILGSSITGVIDMLCAFGIYYHLVLLIISIYRKVMNLDELDDYLPQHLYHPSHGSYEDLHS